MHTSGGVFTGSGLRSAAGSLTLARRPSDARTPMRSGRIIRTWQDHALAHCSGHGHFALVACIWAMHQLARCAASREADLGGAESKSPRKGVESRTPMGAHRHEQTDAAAGTRG